MPNGKMPAYSIIVCTIDNTSGLMDFIKSLLVQRYLPEDLIIVHGKPRGSIKDRVLAALQGSGIQLVYATCPPGLVYQRNLGLELCKSELVLFFDDDVLLENNYIRNLLGIFRGDANHQIGGVTGLIKNMPYSPRLARFFKRFFMLYTGYGDGKMYPSGMPSFLSPESKECRTQFFAGCLMAFRMEAIRGMKFDENLYPYWWGDDFEFCFRVSQRSKLIQTIKSRLSHKGSSVNKQSFRRFWRMQVVNHWYIFRKYRQWYEFPFYVWSLFGNLVFAFLQVLRGYKADGLLGYFEGIAENFGVLKQKGADRWNKDLIRVVYCHTTSDTRGETWKKAEISREC